MFLLNVYNISLRPQIRKATLHDAKVSRVFMYAAYFWSLVLDWDISKSFHKLSGKCPIILNEGIFEKLDIKTK